MWGNSGLLVAFIFSYFVTGIGACSVTSDIPVSCLDYSTIRALPSFAHIEALKYGFVYTRVHTCNQWDSCSNCLETSGIRIFLVLSTKSIVPTQRAQGLSFTEIPALAASVPWGGVTPNGKFDSGVSCKEGVKNIITDHIRKCTMQFSKRVLCTQENSDWHSQQPLPRALLTSSALLKCFSDLLYEHVAIQGLIDEFEPPAHANLGIFVCNEMPCFSDGMSDGTLYKTSACKVMSHYYPFIVRSLMQKPLFCTILQNLPTSVNLLKSWKSYDKVWHYWVYQKQTSSNIFWKNYIRSFDYIHWTGPRAPADFLSVNCLHHQCVCHCCTSHQNRDSTHSATHTNHYSNHDQSEKDSRNALGLYCDGEGADALHTLRTTTFFYFVLFIQLWSLAILCIHLFYCSIRSTLIRHNRKPSRLCIIPEAWIIASLSFLAFHLRPNTTLAEACCHCSCCFTLLLLHCNCANALGCWTLWIHTVTSTCAVLLICQFVATMDSLLVSCFHCNTTPAACLHHYFVNVLYKDWSCWIHSIDFAITAFVLPFLLLCQVTCSHCRNNQDCNYPGNHLKETVNCLLNTIIFAVSFLYVHFNFHILRTCLTQRASLLVHYLQNQCQLLTISINGILADLIPLYHTCCLYLFHAVAFCFQRQTQLWRFYCQETTVYSKEEATFGGQPLISNVFLVGIWNEVSSCISQFATIGKLLSRLLQVVTALFDGLEITTDLYLILESLFDCKGKSVWNFSHWPEHRGTKNGEETKGGSGSSNSRGHSGRERMAGTSAKGNAVTCHIRDEEDSNDVEGAGILFSQWPSVSSEFSVGSAFLSPGITRADQTSAEEEGDVCSSTCHVEQCGGNHEAFSENEVVSVSRDQVPPSSCPLGLLNTQPKEREYLPSISCSVVCEETSSSPGLLVGIHQAFRSIYSACSGLLVGQWQLHTAVDLQIDVDRGGTVPLSFENATAHTTAVSNIGSTLPSPGITRADQTSAEEEGDVCSSTCHVEQCGGNHEALNQSKVVSLSCDQVPLSSCPLGLLNTQSKEPTYPSSIQCSVACEETSSSPGLLVGIQQAFRSIYSACSGLLVCQWQLHTAVDLQIDVHRGTSILLSVGIGATCITDSAAGLSDLNSSRRPSSDRSAAESSLEYPTPATPDPPSYRLSFLQITVSQCNCTGLASTEEDRPIIQQESQQRIGLTPITCSSRCDNVHSQTEKFCRPPSTKQPNSGKTGCVKDLILPTSDVFDVEPDAVPEPDSYHNGPSGEVLQRDSYHNGPSGEVPQPDSYHNGPSGEVAHSRPGKKESNVSKKTRAEPRPPNESYTANVASATAPLPGQRMPPVGSEESAKVGIVQPAAKSIQSPKPAQASDLGYVTGTGSSNRKKDEYNVDDIETPEGVAVEIATCSQCSAEPTFAHTSAADAYKDEQYCMAHIPLNPQPNTVHRSELTNGKIKSVSPMLKALKECSNPKKYFDPVKFLEALQLDSLLPRKEVDTSLYVTNRAKLEQMYPYLFEGQIDAVPNVVYSTLKFTVSEEAEARAVKDKFAVNLRIGWNALKDCLAIRYVNVERLAQKLLPRKSMAEWMEKKDNWQRIVVELRYFLKLKAERHLTRPRVVHALLVTAGDVEFINDVMSAGESLSGDNPTLPEIQEFLSGFQEPVMFDKVFTEIVESLKVAGEWGVANELQERGATKSNPMHLFGVWLATAAATTRPATWSDFVQLLRKAGVDEGVVQTVPGGPWDSHQSDMFHVSVGQQPPVTAKAVQELSTKQVDQPRAWNERMLASANERNRDIEDVDAKHSARTSADQQSSDSAGKSKFFYEDQPSLSNVDARSQGVGVPSQSGLAARRQPSQAPHTNQPVPRVTATTALSNREKEEEHYLSLPLDPSDPKSILYHAKAVYLTLDYNNTRRILDILAHHLLIDEEMLRAKVFGYAISFYRQRNFPPALERLDELEKLALEHHSAGDVSLSCIYRGEVYMAQKKLDQAFRMFDHARATYDENNVSTYYGIIILSKCAVMVKAANCQKQLMDYRKAKEVYHMAIEFAEKVRLTKEALPLDEPDRKNKVEAAYRDEITARCSLGNLFQNMSDCANALEQYEVVLHLQGKIEGDRAALGWAEGNYGNALLGLNRLKESIPHLQRAFELARKHERGNQGISRAASNLGNALQAAKQYADAQNSFEIALGHSVFSGDEVGHARALGNLGNVKLVKGEPLEALRYYNEALSLNSDDTSLYTAYQNRASVYITLAAKVNEGVGEWDEVPEDIMAEEPREAISIQLPVEEQTKEAENFRHQHMVLPSGRTLPRGGLDDSEEYFKRKDSSPSQSEVLSGAGSSVPSTGGPPPQQGSSTRLGTSHTHYLRYRKFYLRRAEEDLRKVVNFVEDRFAKVKGKEDTNSLALSIFEANSKAFYSLQKVLVCLGRSQEALKIAEANRARNLGEVMLSAKKSIFSLSSVKVPLDLSTIWSFANSEQTPVAVLSCDVSCILVHIIVPQDEQSSLVPVGRYGRLQTPASDLTRGGEEAIPANCYHFFKIELFTDTFSDEWSRNREARPTSDNVTFEQYVTKNLMDFLNAKETNLFEPVDFEPRDNPLTVLFDQFARKFAEVIEATAPEFHELVVIADQALHLLPWPVLQDKTSRKFLGDRYRIRTYPSILTMGVISSQPAPVITLPSEERFLVVGNPAIPKFINQKKEVSLGRLPHAEDEATQVSHILETKPLLREQATKQTVIYRLQMANLVHIATHGSGSQGYIALASNMPVLSSTNAVAVDAKECLLFIDEIQRLHIGAALVVLSACDSARGEIVNEGVNSVARAILAAGAQSVLVSLVRVPDKSASIFMRLFYRFLAHDGMTTSEALQKSSMGVRCIKSLSQHVHWGGFQLIGQNIQMIYNNESNSAKVATLVGDPTPFPRLELLQQLEKAIFRNDRTPPRDVVLVKGLSFNDPAEVVRDFICKHFKHYPGGVFWYNAASEDHLDASVSFVKQTVPHLKTIQREPPVEKVIPDKKKKTLLDGSGGESYDNHYRLIVLDHPASMASCLAKIPEIHSSHSDIIVIHTADTDRDQSLTRWVDEQLVRGCTPIVAGPLDKYDSIQRMAYSILRSSHITPYEEDYEAFDILQKFCHGSSSLVRLMEGMLCREEPEMELRQLASDITRMPDMEPNVITRPGQQDRPAAEKKTSLFKRPGKSKDRARGHGITRNGYIHETPELTAEDHVRLSNDYEMPARLFFPIDTLLVTRMTQEEHFLLIAIGYLTLYPKAHSEGTFTFTDQFLNQLATVITEAGGRATEPHFLVKKLEERHVIRQYPLPVLSPPDYESTFKLFYVPDSIVRAVTFDLDQADEAFILTTCSSAVQHLSELHSYHSYHSALKKKIALLYAESGLPSQQQ